MPTYQSRDPQELAAVAAQVNVVDGHLPPTGAHADCGAECAPDDLVAEADAHDGFPLVN